MIKPNNPHLAGGEQQLLQQQPPGNIKFQSRSTDRTLVWNPEVLVLDVSFQCLSSLRSNN